MGSWTPTCFGEAVPKETVRTQFTLTGGPIVLFYHPSHCGLLSLASQDLFHRTQAILAGPSGGPRKHTHTHRKDSSLDLFIFDSRKIFTTCFALVPSTPMESH